MPRARSCCSNRPNTAPGGKVGQCGGLRRATRPPSGSISTGARSFSTTPRKSAISALTRSGASMLRATRIRPSGLRTPNSTRSSAVSCLPAQPTTTGAKPAQSTPLASDNDAALLLGGKLFADALRGGAILHRSGLEAHEAALAGNVDALVARGQAAEQIAVFLLQLGPGGLRGSTVLERCELHLGAAAWCCRHFGCRRWCRFWFRSRCSCRLGRRRTGRLRL